MVFHIEVIPIEANPGRPALAYASHCRFGICGMRMTMLHATHRKSKSLDASSEPIVCYGEKLGGSTRLDPVLRKCERAHHVTGSHSRVAIGANDQRGQRIMPHRQ